MHVEHACLAVRSDRQFAVDEHRSVDGGDEARQLHRAALGITVTRVTRSPVPSGRPDRQA